MLPDDLWTQLEAEEETVQAEADERELADTVLSELEEEPCKHKGFISPGGFCEDCGTELGGSE